MASLTLRFYAELNELLAKEQRYVRFTHACELPASVKSVVEALGVPANEIDVVLVNGESVELSHALADADDIAVYPAFGNLDVSPVTGRKRRRFIPLATLLVPVLVIWMLPQTLAGIFFALYRHTRPRFVCFGPLLCAVIPTHVPGAAGISLGLITFAEHPSIVRHELCHVITGLWLGWLYLPVYGLEYLILGHRRSWHERITRWLETRVGWQVRGIAW